MITFTLRISITVPPKTHCVSNLPNKLKGMFEMKVRTLETMTPTVVVLQKEWSNLADHEKLPFLEQLINEKLKDLKNA